MEMGEGGECNYYYYFIVVIIVRFCGDMVVHIMNIYGIYNSIMCEVILFKWLTLIRLRFNEMEITYAMACGEYDVRRGKR